MIHISFVYKSVSETQLIETDPGKCSESLLVLTKPKRLDTPQIGERTATILYQHDYLDVKLLNLSLSTSLSQYPPHH